MTPTLNPKKSIRLELNLRNSFICTIFKFLESVCQQPVLHTYLISLSVKPVGESRQNCLSKGWFYSKKKNNKITNSKRFKAKLYSFTNSCATLITYTSSINMIWHITWFKEKFDQTIVWQPSQNLKIQHGCLPPIDL